MYYRITARVFTWDLEQEVISHRVTRAAFLDDQSRQEVVVVDGNRSMIIDDEGGSVFWNLL